ncbi:hypothetical protein KCV06_g684, partial [Aureobasidium melanogenum]
MRSVPIPKQSITINPEDRYGFAPVVVFLPRVPSNLPVRLCILVGRFICKSGIGGFAVCKVGVRILKSRLQSFHTEKKIENTVIVSTTVPTTSRIAVARKIYASITCFLGQVRIMSLFWILEKHSGCLRDDDGTDMMSRADIADFLSVEQLENVHRGEDFEDNNKDIAVGDVSASERRLDNDQNQFDGSGHIMVDEAPPLCLIKVLILFCEAFHQRFEEINSHKKDNHAADNLSKTLVQSSQRMYAKTDNERCGSSHCHVAPISSFLLAAPLIRFGARSFVISEKPQDRIKLKTKGSWRQRAAD